MLYINHLHLTASRVPIHAELAGSRQCSAAGISVDAYAPVCALARALIAAGYDPNRMLEVYRGTILCFRVPLATAARLTVKDGKDGVPRFEKYVPFPAARVARPLRQIGSTAPAEPTATAGAIPEAV